MTDQFVFLSKNAYKAKTDGSYRCYLDMAQSSGEVISLNASAVRLPKLDPFDVCSVSFSVQLYAGNQAFFVLEGIDVIGSMVYDTDKKEVSKHDGK